MSTTSCGRLDAYDLGNGSVLLAWPPFGGAVPDAYHVYANGVLQTQVTFSPSYFDLETGQGHWQLENGTGYFELEAPTQGFGGSASVSGLTQTTYSSGAVAASSGNSLRPQNMPPSGVVTPSGTYVFQVVAVKQGVEVATSDSKKITIAPASIMLTTPMKRLWPFPNTGLD